MGAGLQRGERTVGQLSEGRERKGEGKRHVDHTRSYKRADGWQTTCQDGKSEERLPDTAMKSNTRHNVINDAPDKLVAAEIMRREQREEEQSSKKRKNGKEKRIN